MNRAEIQREKLINAIIFFTKKTRACHKLKLFKLLFFLDFNIYRATGKTTTGLDYFAWPMGPVPNKLFDELNAPASDMNAAMLITQGTGVDPDFQSGPGNRALVFKPRRAFDDGWFTPRELKEMERLAAVYEYATAKQMTDVSHVPGSPWHTVYEVLKSHQAPIPYELALDEKPGSITKEQAEVIADELREGDKLFR